MNYEVKNVWSVLLRLYHWALVLSIVALVVTGFYINNPWTNTTLEGSVSFPMCTMRYIHFVAGYLFGAAVLIRLFCLSSGISRSELWIFCLLLPEISKA